MSHLKLVYSRPVDFKPPESIDPITVYVVDINRNFLQVMDNMWMSVLGCALISTSVMSGLFYFVP